MKGTSFKLILLLLLTLSIPVSFVLSIAVGITIKYETELGQFPTYIDPASIPNDPEQQKVFLNEIHESLLYQYHLLRIWWLPASILLVILFSRTFKK